MIRHRVPRLRGVAIEEVAACVGDFLDRRGAGALRDDGLSC
jgi:hypothetical protein